jgi:hypothetical protein
VNKQKKRHAFAWRFSSCPTAKFGRDLEAGASGQSVSQRPCLPFFLHTFQTTSLSYRERSQLTVNDFDTGHGLTTDRATAADRGNPRDSWNAIH